MSGAGAAMGARAGRMAALLATALAASAVDARGAGLRIYRDGVLPSGAPLQGTAQRGIPRAGAAAACAACHRRSGYGTSEGPIFIPPVTASALFGWRAGPAAPMGAPAAGGLAPANREAAQRQARLARLARIAALQGERRRPPYDDAALARAIREGVDVTGRPLGPGMPRYPLRDDEVKGLVAYLRTLSAEPSPGVTSEEIHLATVVQPGVDPAQRRAMLEVLQAFVRDKNAGTRSELQRRRAGLERDYRAYRTWVLDVWDLTGPPEGWAAQLDARQARRPVFALIGGLASASWSPIHAWSERVGVPCLFPQADLPSTSGAGFYTVYLSRGIALEAEALAKHLRDRPERGPVAQVFRRDGASAAAAAAFREAMRGAPGPALEERVVDGPLPAGAWERIGREEPGRTLVLWLGEPDLAGAAALLAAGSAVEEVFLSATLLGDERRGLAPGAEGRVRLVDPLDLPRARGARLLGVKRWLHEKGIALSHERVQLNAYFAIAVTADAMSHVSDLFSREFLVERVEHVVGNSVAPSIYARVSLGPDQRFASKGSYIVRRTGAGELEPVSGWITP